MKDKIGNKVIIKTIRRGENGFDFEELGRILNDIIIDGWGRFHNDFVVKHIIESDMIAVAYISDQPVGFSSLNIKNIHDRKVHYFEFLAVKQAYQSSGVGGLLVMKTMAYTVVNSLFTLLFHPLEVMFITPNVRVLCYAAKISSWVYPNPYTLKDDLSVEPADDLTWEMTKKLIEQSDKPNRPIHREGNVLEKSYEDLPDLIYTDENAPWHYDERINEFAKKYLGYGRSEDKEFVVRLKISLLSIGRYYFKKSLNLK